MLFAVCVRAQTVQVVINVKSKDGDAVTGADITLKGTKDFYQTAADRYGEGRVKVLPGDYLLTISSNEYKKLQKQLVVGSDSTVQHFSFQLESSLDSTTLGETTIEGRKEKKDAFGITLIDPQKISEMPVPNPSVEASLVLLPGVGVSSEFSSQYRVRGGNYDENLIYINGVEIYRPQLVRTGQQEGLGATNTMLTSNVLFSTGGFAAQYGDKLSSALDVEYRKPNRFHGTVELGLLTANLHLEGSSKNRADSTQPGAFSFLVGGRRFSTTYLLNSLDTKGDYRPEFYDGQMVLGFAPRSKRPTVFERQRKDGRVDTIVAPVNRFKMSLLTLFTWNRYTLIPESKETTFGVFTNIFKLFVGYAGQEQTNYSIGQAALTFEHTPNLRLSIKNIIGGAISEESELTTLEGAYRLSDINTDLGSDKFGQEIFIRGAGSEIRNARNYLSVKIFNVSHQGELKLGRNFYKNLCDTCYVKHRLSWGVKGQVEMIDDLLREWVANDSADYIKMRDRVNTQNVLNSWRVSGFVQHNWRLSKSAMLVSGVRANYWSLNEDFFVSPRIQFILKPGGRQADGSRLPFEQRRVQIRFAVGSYNQQPFYRELRALNGAVYPSIMAQRSYHFIAGTDINFKWWGRPFNVFGEIYAKWMTNLVPYEIENVRIRYYPDKISGNDPYNVVGLVYGLDARISGQFIKGIDSWLSVSTLRAQEKVNGDTVNSVWIPRPTDQRLMISMFFQDYIPRVPWLRMNMTMIFNSGIPFGPPTVFENRTGFRNPYYFRVDLGMNALLKFKERSVTRRKFGIESVWIGIEVFNLFARENTISHNWVKDIYETQFAIPNYLSTRLINGRIIVKF